MQQNEVERSKSADVNSVRKVVMETGHEISRVDAQSLSVGSRFPVSLEFFMWKHQLILFLSRYLSL